jgi:TolB-like protein
MVTREGRVKVLDFGLAKMTGSDRPSHDLTVAATAEPPISVEGQVVGTVPYMAPEQLRGETVDARSDLFALGVILYELAAGRRPFGGETSIDVAHAVLRDAPEPLTGIRTDLPEEFHRIVGGCLEKNSRERVQTALDVHNGLRRLRGASPEAGPAGRASEHVASIAVLPFVNRSADPGDEYFSDGLADELLDLLAKIKDLRVSARTSSFTFKGQQVTVAEIGRVLNVATILEGSVRKAGNRVRISVQLVKVADGYHLWSETYDRTLEDIFAVQDDIAQAVVSELRTKLLGEEAGSDARVRAKAEVAQAARGRGTDPEAHRLYLLARHLVDRRTREDVAKAVEYLNDALSRDPDFAVAWSELGRARSTQAGVGWTPRAKGVALARAAQERALALDPGLAEAHARMGWIRLNYDWDWPGAEASYSRARELAPGNARVLSGAGVLARCQGRLEEAIRLARLAMEQDPLSPGAYTNLAGPLQDADRLEEAEDVLRKALELAPRRTGTRAFLALILLAQDRAEEALEEALREPDEVYRLRSLAIVHHAMGHGAEAEAAMDLLIKKYAGRAAFQVAEVLGARGEMDAALDWLTQAYENRDGGLSEVRTNPRFRSLHGDPRWAAFMRKMGFED